MAYGRHYGIVNHRKRLQADRRHRMNMFLDLVAEGVSVRDAAQQIGVSGATGTSMMAQARRELGPQAR